MTKFNNPARSALTATVNRAIASGSPVFIEQPVNPYVTESSSNPVTNATAMIECADLVAMADWHAKQSAEFHSIGGMLNEIRAARHAKEAKRHYSMAADYMSQAYA